MMNRQIVIGLPLVLCSGMWLAVRSAADDGPPAPPKIAVGVPNVAIDKPAAVTSANTATRQLMLKLQEPTDKLRNGIDTGTPLEEAVDFIMKSHDFICDIDEAAFRADGEPNIAKKPVELAKKRGVPVGEALQAVLSRLEPQGTYYVRGGRVIITTPTRAVIDTGHPNVADAPFFANLVSFACQDRSLTDALQQIADHHGRNILVDPKVAEKAKTPVAFHMQLVPFPTATRALAKLVGLDIVEMDNLIFVTSEECAKTMRDEWKKTSKDRPKPATQPAGGA